MIETEIVIVAEEGMTEIGIEIAKEIEVAIESVNDLENVDEAVIEVVIANQKLLRLLHNVPDRVRLQ